MIDAIAKTLGELDKRLKTINERLDNLEKHKHIYGFENWGTSEPISDSPRNKKTCDMTNEELKCCSERHQLKLFNEQLEEENNKLLAVIKEVYDICKFYTDPLMQINNESKIARLLKPFVEDK